MKRLQSFRESRHALRESMRVASCVKLSKVSAFNSVSSIRTPKVSSTYKAKSIKLNESIKPLEINVSSAPMVRLGCLRILEAINVLREEMISVIIVPLLKLFTNHRLQRWSELLHQQLFTNFVEV